MQVLKDEIKNSILSVAEDMFFESGFSNTTMRNIAETVGISVSNLYLYYKNKEAIFSDVVGSFAVSFTNELTKFLKHLDSETDVNADLARMLRRIISQHHKKFVILLDGSSQTSYADIKAQILESLKSHVLVQVNQAYKDDNWVFTIILSNFFNGIIEIARHYENEELLERSLTTLVSYHKTGFRQFL